MKVQIRQKLVAAALAAVAIATSASAQVSFRPSQKKVVNIPLNSWVSVAAQKGWLQEEFAKYGADVKLFDLQATGGVAGQEAALLTKGDIHFAFRMAYPSLIHHSNGLDARVIWSSVASDKHKTPVLTLRDSSINDISELKGKNFGGGRVGCGWSSPWEAFREAGIPLSSPVKKGDVNHIVIEGASQTISALYGNQIQAFSTHIALQPWAGLITQGVLKVIGRNSEDGNYTQGAGRTSIFAMREFAEKHPELVKAFLDTRLRTAKWINENPDQAASIISRDRRVPKYVARFQIVDPSAYDQMDGEPNWNAAVAAAKSFQQWYKDNDDDILNRPGQFLSDAKIESFYDKRFYKGGEFSSYN